MHQFKCVHRERHYGFSLIELVSALMISTILIGQFYIYFMNFNQAFIIQIGLMRIEGRANEVIAHISHSIHQLGKIGCIKVTKNYPQLSFASIHLNAHTQIIGDDQSMTVQYLEGFSTNLRTTQVNQSSMLVSDQRRFHSNEIVIIHDCLHAEINQIQKIVTVAKSYQLSFVRPLEHTYNTDAEVSALQIDRFFVSKTMRFDVKHRPIYALYKEDINHYRHELVEGINKIRFKYAINNANHFRILSFNQILAWHDVIGIAVEIHTEASGFQKVWYHFFASGK